MPTYNRADTIDRAISSVRSQTIQAWELLIVDNSSSDNTLQIISSYQNIDPRIKLFIIDNKGIIARSRNLAIKASNSPFIAFLDSDDFWYPDKLSESLKSLQYGADIVYHPMHVIDTGAASQKKIPTKLWRIESNPLKELLYKGNCIVNSGVVVRHSALASINYLSEDPSHKAVEDFLCWLALAEYSFRFTPIRKPLGAIQIDSANTTTLEVDSRRTLIIINSYKAMLNGYTPVWALFKVLRAKLYSPYPLSVLPFLSLALRRVPLYLLPRQTFAILITFFLLLRQNLLVCFRSVVHFLTHSTVA